ncbi:MAG TPA: hypothetical protein VGA77_07420 [Propylenella sp.]
MVDWSGCPYIEGGYVLDILTPRLEKWGRSGYAGKSIQSPDNQWRWLAAM